MARFGEPEELVGAALLLVSREAGSFVTGATLCVDGGFYGHASLGSQPPIRCGVAHTIQHDGREANQARNALTSAVAFTTQPGYASVENQSLVIFGASGDLTSRKLVPALYRLNCKGRLPDDLRIVGFSRSALQSRRLA